MRDSRFTVRTAPGLWVALALMVLVLPLPWLLAILLSSTVHELCHLAAVRIIGVPVTGLRLGADGAYLDTAPMTPLQGLICAVAGPLGSLAILFFARWMPRTALCAAVQFFYHLLPFHPLDGGRAMRSLTDYFGWSQKVCFVTEIVVMAVLVLTGAYFAATGLGLLPLILSFTIIFRACREKYLANRVGTEYNIPTKYKEVRL